MRETELFKRTVRDERSKPLTRVLVTENVLEATAVRGKNHKARTNTNSLINAELEAARHQANLLKEVKQREQNINQVKLTDLINTIGIKEAIRRLENRE